MKNIICILFLTISFLSCDKKTNSNNVIVILVDDLGWTDLGYSGSSFYETPNIDALSEKSVVFTNAYSSSPVCSPTRAAIMTGQHPSRVNITDWIPGNDPQDQVLQGPVDLHELPHSANSLAEVYKAKGFKTFFAGKWHLGGEGFFPESQGFDYNFGGHEKGQPPGGYYSPYKNPTLQDGPEGEYLTDRLTNESINFINNSRSDPFFLYLSYYTVHTPIEASKKHIEKFEKKLASLEEKGVIQKVDKTGSTTVNQVNIDYASMVYALDENVGRLVFKLKEEGIYDQTTIVFTSDNGGLSTLDTAYHRIGPTSVLPLRGGKGWLYEGGIRVPLFIKPAKFKLAGVKSDYPVVSHDLFPTLLSMSSIDLPSEVITDGKDITPLLDSSVSMEDRTIFWDYPHYHGSGWRPGGAIRKGDWKLIEFYEDEHCELYNLKEDISEQNDRSGEHPELVKELRREFKDWKKTLDILPLVRQNP